MEGRQGRNESFRMLMAQIVEVYQVLRDQFRDLVVQDLNDAQRQLASAIDQLLEEADLEPVPAQDRTLGDAAAADVIDVVAQVVPVDRAVAYLRFVIIRLLPMSHLVRWF